MIKGLVLQEDKTVLNIYTPSNRASEYIRQKLIEAQGETDKFTIILGDLNIRLSVTDRFSRQKIIKNIVETHDTFNQLHLIDIHKILLKQQTTQFLSSHETFIQINHILGHQIHLKKLKKKLKS